MNPNTKKILTQTLAVLGVTVLTGGAYFFASSGTQFQAQLLGANPANELTLVDDTLSSAPSVDVLSAAQENTQAVSSVFDATPLTATQETVLTGSTMLESSMSGTLLATTEAQDEQTAVQELIDLRPAAMEEPANSLLQMFGASNTNGEIASSAVTAADILAPFRSDNQNSTSGNANTNAEDLAAQAALEQAPHVPQTGAETWLLAVSILCAMMGMTMLMTSPKQL